MFRCYLALIKNALSKTRNWRHDNEINAYNLLFLFILLFIFFYWDYNKGTHNSPELRSCENRWYEWSIQQIRIRSEEYRLMVSHYHRPWIHATLTRQKRVRWRPLEDRIWWNMSWTIICCMPEFHLFIIDLYY